MMPIKVIDIFAGPGGLGEGFSSLVDENENPLFKVALSIEKEKWAYDTLLLRSFYRQYKKSEVPDDYYSHLRGEISRQELFARHHYEFIRASKEAWQATLGETSEEEIDERIKTALDGAEPWVLIGGPPCQAYSLVGRARRGETKGLNKEDERVYLYREYFRILAVHNPHLFVMENVKGLLSSKIDDELIFKQLILDLQNPFEAYSKLKGKKNITFVCPGYKIFSLVSSRRNKQLQLFDVPQFNSFDFVIRAEEYGIPQARHRVILLGVRNDLSINDIPLLIKEPSVPLKVVIDGLPRIRSTISKAKDSKTLWVKNLKALKKQLKELKIERAVKKEINKVLKELKPPKYDNGKEFIRFSPFVSYKPDWFLDKRILGVVNHSSRGHIIKDLYRYLFSSCYTVIHKVSPRLYDFPIQLLPVHQNVNKAIQYGTFVDRFKVQLPYKPSNTITSHISKDSHYYIHPDPSQCRSFSVREAARIQTFPDNYFFCGQRTAQYIQVGNAVPPLLAIKIATIVYKTVNNY
ncbi:MAG: DNA cytosine methyltransferase [Chitinophagales bacterium]|nr:DNA cytosine methyltransferase [Chitinophagales bacterium]